MIPTFILWEQKESWVFECSADTLSLTLEYACLLFVSVSSLVTDFNWALNGDQEWNFSFIYCLKKTLPRELGVDGGENYTLWTQDL